MKPTLFAAVAILAGPYFAAMADDAVYPKLSIRAFQCQPYEYAEINDMSRAELDGAYCGYIAGGDFAKSRADLNREKYKEQPNTIAALLGDYVRQSERCTQGLEKVSDSLSRKFSASPPDCKAALAKLEEARRKAQNRTNTSPN